MYVIEYSEEKQPILRMTGITMLCNNLILQQYKDAKSRIGKHKCPYCQDDVEFDDDTTVLFRIFKKIEVFTPNRLVDYGEPSIYCENATLDHVCLCTAQVYCKKCGEIVEIYSYERYIDQMREIIDHLKLKEIDISMPRPRDLINGKRELITFFIVDDMDFVQYDEDFDDEDEENDEDKPEKEYTEDGVYISTQPLMTFRKSFLTRFLDRTYTCRD